MTLETTLAVITAAMVGIAIAGLSFMESCPAWNFC